MSRRVAAWYGLRQWLGVDWNNDKDQWLRAFRLGVLESCVYFRTYTHNHNT